MTVTSPHYLRRFSRLSLTTLLLACGASSSTTGPDAAAGRDADLSPPPPTPDPPLPPGATPPYRSGTRLRAVLYRAEDGTAVFGGFHDSKLDFSCRLFQRIDDGPPRCAPMEEHRGWDFAYSDRTCRTPVLAAYPALPPCEIPEPPHFFMVPITPPVSATTCVFVSNNLYRLGPMSTVPATYRPVGSPAFCTQVSNQESMVTAHGLTRVPADELVALENKSEVRGAVRIGLQTSDDGGVAATGGFESLDGRNRCGFSSVSRPDELYCGTFTRSSDEIEFADAQCKSPLLAPATHPCLRDITVAGIQVVFPDPGSGYWSAPMALNPRQPRTCRTTRKAFQLKGPFGGAGVEVPRYKLVDGVCREHSRAPVTGYTVFAEGDLPPPEPVRTVMVGTGRLRLPTVVNAKGEKLLSERSFYDFQRHEYCEPIRLRGSLRCIPTYSDPEFTPAYTDAACSNMVLLANGPDCLNRDSPRYYWHFDNSISVCPGPDRRRLFERGRVITPGDLFEHRDMLMRAGPCIPRRDPKPPAAVYEVTELFPEDFAPLERVVE